MSTADMSSTEHKELKSGWKNEVEAKTISKDEVQRHNAKKDLWMILHGKGSRTSLLDTRPSQLIPLSLRLERVCQSS